MKVDENIARAISQYIAASGTTQKAFASKLGVSEATMVKWRKPGNGVAEARWKTLFPLIRPYLPKSRLYVSGAGEVEYSSMLGGRRGRFREPSLIPFLQTSDLIKYNPVVSIEQFAQTEKLARIEYRPKVPGIGGMFGFDLVNASAGVPGGARLFVSSEAKPKNGSLVLAATNTAEIVLGHYSAAGRMFELDAGERRETGRIEDIRRLFTGFFPVIAYEVICY